jgi:hypothetical protein
MVVIMCLILGGRESFTVAYTNCSVACSDDQFIENKFVFLMECVVNRRAFCIL